MATAYRQGRLRRDRRIEDQGHRRVLHRSWKKGDPVILKRNPNYWKNTPGIDTVDIEYVPDDNTRVLKLQGGEDDVVDFVPFSQIDPQPAAGRHGAGLPHPADDVHHPERHDKPLDDNNVRQALNYATDKDAIIKSVFFGQAQPMNAPIPLGTYVDTKRPATRSTSTRPSS